jgi:hypothetical protein
MNSIGDVCVDDIKSDVVYVKEKEKQAQIVGPLTSRTSNDIILNFLKEIKVRTGNPSNKLTGCSMLDSGDILFSEYNLHENTDRVTLNDNDGNFIRTVRPTRRQDPHYRRQHPAESVKVKCLQMTIFLVHSKHNSSRFVC